MIHWEGPYVTGFISFGETPQQAVKALKKALWVKVIQPERPRSELSPERVKAFLKSLKRPWRETKAKKPMVSYTELILPVYSGYWLMDIIQGQNHCNLPTDSNPADAYWKKAGES